MHLPWSEGKLWVVDIQAFEGRDGALCRKKILARLGGGAPPPSLSGLGARLGRGGGALPLSLNKNGRQMENSPKRRGRRNFDKI